MACHSTLPALASPGAQEARWQGYADAYGLLAAAETALSFGYVHLVQLPASCDAVGCRTWLSKVEERTVESVAIHGCNGHAGPVPDGA